MKPGPRFAEIFGKNPIVAAQAPGRVNLMGDHTDYNQGFVLPTIIPQQTVVEAGFGADQHEVYSATLGRMTQFNGGELADFGRYVGGCVRVVEERGAKIPPLQLRISSDVPVGAGLSSSAALEVATIRALNSLLDLGLGPDDVALLAYRAEVEHAGVACGIMDQIACSIGQPDLMLFLDTMTMERHLVPLPEAAEILVIDSGIPRELAGTQYNQRRAECAAAAAMLGVPSLRLINDPAAVERLPSPFRERARHVISENLRVLAAVEADAVEFGALMTASHASLRDDYAVSAPALDKLVAALQIEKGVFGARLTGAGFGGSCVALVAEGKTSAIGGRITAQTSLSCKIIVPQAQQDGIAPAYSAGQCRPAQDRELPGIGAARACRARTGAHRAAAARAGPVRGGTRPKSATASHRATGACATAGTEPGAGRLATIETAAARRGPAGSSRTAAGAPASPLSISGRSATGYKRCN